MEVTGIYTCQLLQQGCKEAKSSAEHSDGVDVQEGRAATPAEATLLSTSEASTLKEVLSKVQPTNSLAIVGCLVYLLGLETARSLLWEVLWL